MLGGTNVSAPLLQVINLHTYFRSSGVTLRAVDGVDLVVNRGETLSVVGESGCGKSVTALSIMRLVPNPPGEIRKGRILFDGENLLDKSETEMQAIRGNEISMIFQEPMTSLNPVHTCGRQIAESVRLHRGLSGHEAFEEAVEMLRRVGIPEPEQRAREYPHQLSGGMRQRVMIAMALACRPKLLIADEPTTALDVTIQAQILDLMRKLRDELGMAIMLITHDLGVVAEMSDRVAVMYAGKVVEEADVRSIFDNPLHPYTVGLLGLYCGLPTPSPGCRLLKAPFQGCATCRRDAASTRCSRATDKCREPTAPGAGRTVSEGGLLAPWRTRRETARGQHHAGPTSRSRNYRFGRPPATGGGPQEALPGGQEKHLPARSPHGPRRRRGQPDSAQG